MNLLLLCLILSVPLGQSDQFTHQWSQVGHLYQKYAYPNKDSLSYLIRVTLNDSLVNADVGHACIRDLSDFAHQLDIATTDAMAMLDSFSQRKPGAASGLILDFGHYEQCNSIEISSVRGKYFLVRADPPLPLHDVKVTLTGYHSYDWLSELTYYVPLFEYGPFLLGICLPSTCDEGDVQTILTSPSVCQSLDPIKLSLEKPYTTDDKNYQLIKSLGKVVLVCLVILNVTGTALSSRSFLSVFDVKSNVKALFRESTSKSAPFISLMKVAYTLTSTVLHIFVPINYYQSFHLVKPATENMYNNVYYRWSFLLMSMMLSFNFVIAAILSVITWMPIFKRTNGDVNFTSFVIVRALRTLPVQMFIIGLVILLPEFNLGGPLMEIASANMSGTCYENAWADLSFVSNLRPLHTLCNRVGWFMSADMQLYASSFAILYLLSKHDVTSGGNHHRTLLMVLFVISYIAYAPISEKIMNAAVTVLYQPKEFLTNPAPIISLYFNSLLYLPAYIAGILIGFEINVGTKMQPQNLAKGFFGSICLHLVSIAALYLTFGSANSTTNFHFIAFTLSNILYIATFCAFLFTLWSATNHWIMTAISNNLFITILSKISFAQFMIHPFIIVLTMLKLDIFYWSYGHLYFILLPFVLTFSSILGFVIHVCVEMPFAKILAYLVSKEKLRSNSVECTRL